MKKSYFHNQVEECTRLAEEFNEVTAIHDAKIKAKKQRQYID